jgi:hypothetical protein
MEAAGQNPERPAVIQRFPAAAIRLRDEYPANIDDRS